MLAKDLKFSEIFRMHPEYEALMFGSHKMLLVPARLLESCLENLRQVISPDNLEEVMINVAYEAGIGGAVSLAELYNYTSSEDWLKAGSWLWTYLGYAKGEITESNIELSKNQVNFRGFWQDSFQADSWLNLDRKSEKPICSFMTNLIRGYASAIFNKNILVKELTCKSQGYDRCTFEGRPLEDWDEDDEVFKKPVFMRPASEHIKTIQQMHKKQLENLEKNASRKTIRKTKPDDDELNSGIVARSEAMAQSLILARKVAPSRATVLVQGHSGTGKEVLARHIHRYSGKKDEPFMAVNCAAIPVNLIESELFGHVKGAFTGAISHKEGLLVRAGDGTVFLDEIAELPLELQPKLLRVLQEKKVRPVGGVDTIPVKARFIAATNKDLKERIAQGTFREDLYFRLAVFPIRLCSLNERREDILLLARHFISKTNPDHPGITPEALRVLKNYTWPGNIRELENCIEYAMILADDDPIMISHLPSSILKSSESDIQSITHDMPSLKELDERYTKMVLEHTKNNRTEAAKILNIGITTLWRRLKEYGISSA